MTSPPGSLTLDICAVTAALATSQYTIQQIRHAVLTFFCHTSESGGNLCENDMPNTCLCTWVLFFLLLSFIIIYFDKIYWKSSSVLNYSVLQWFLHLKNSFAWCWKTCAKAAVARVKITQINPVQTTNQMQDCVTNRSNRMRKLGQRSQCVSCWMWSSYCWKLIVFLSDCRCNSHTSPCVDSNVCI